MDIANDDQPPPVTIISVQFCISRQQRRIQMSHLNDIGELRTRIGPKPAAHFLQRVDIQGLEQDGMLLQRGLDVTLPRQPKRTEEHDENDDISSDPRGSQDRQQHSHAPGSIALGRGGRCRRTLPAYRLPLVLHVVDKRSLTGAMRDVREATKVSRSTAVGFIVVAAGDVEIVEVKIERRLPQLVVRHGGERTGRSQLARDPSIEPRAIRSRIESVAPNELGQTNVISND